MYQTSSAPSFIDSLPLSIQQSGFDVDRWKEYSIQSRISRTASSGGSAGLQTPPADDMSNPFSYQQPNDYSSQKDVSYVPDNGMVESNYANSNLQNRAYAVLHLPPLASSSHTHSQSEIQHSQQIQMHPSSRTGNIVGSSSSSNNNNYQIDRGDRQRKKENKKENENVQTCSLVIPSTISSDGGSLSDFAAQITCLFWFESIETLNDAENVKATTVFKPLRSEAMPANGFRKWVGTILSTTQVTDKVVILALLFIYRLKQYNSGVRGRSGSEYRLLTVALMLGNKFLDDNTYTNNTWAEVSGISVQEIHVMEVEFLSNMRYSLLASKEQWEEWHEKLRNFKTYCEVSLLRALSVQRPLLPMPSPPDSTRASPPPNIYHYTQVPPLAMQWTGNSSIPSCLPNHISLPPPQPHCPRKRSVDAEMTESPASKRLSSTVERSASFSNLSLMSDTRLPAPSNLVMSQGQPMRSNLQVSTNPLTNPVGQNLILPPPGTLPSLATRPMYVSLPATPSWPQQLPFPTPSDPHSSHGYTTPSRRMSPHSHASMQDMIPYNSTPSAAQGFTGQAEHISPSSYLQPRTSPYKPVRNVKTLLYPPQLDSMHENVVNVDEMRYRPLAKSNKNVRAGVVPYLPVQRNQNFHS